MGSRRQPGRAYLAWSTSSSAQVQPARHWALEVVTSIEHWINPDQTDIPAMIGALSAIEHHYPLLRQPWPQPPPKPLPGDDLLPRAQYRSTRAITIAATPEGCGRGWFRSAADAPAGTPTTY